jgi:hypothetical protein
MSKDPKAKQIDVLMEQASDALSKTAYFQAEHLADQALRQARQVEDFGRMARIILPLQEARRQRLQQATETGDVVVLDTPVADDQAIDPGCYLVRPPLVGADARRFRLAAFEQEAPVVVVCREPTSKLGLCPIVAISPGVTVRTKVDQPDDEDQPDLAWFLEALEELGDFAIRTIDPEMALVKRVDALMARLDAVPEHELLHQELEEACHAAQREQAEQPKKSGGSRKRSSGSASAS